MASESAINKVLFTGGGTAGHVTPNLALIERARERGWDAIYVGSKGGIERDIIAPLNIPFFEIQSGKLRRYFSWENFVDPLRIIVGILQSLLICLRERPDRVFSKGGFVSVPVVVAAWLCRIPVICHESDVTPGLANRLAYPFCARICVTFSETLRYLPAGKARHTGTPLRESLLHGDAARGIKHLALDGKKPLMLAFGGSLGANVINTSVRNSLDALLQKFDVLHVVGAGNLDQSLVRQGYIQKEFMHEEFGDVLAASTVVVSRAGANSLYELLSLRKPHVLIPLSRKASRGDQIDNARLFAEKGFSQVLYEDEYTDQQFAELVLATYERREEIAAQLNAFEVGNSQDDILELVAVPKV